MREHDQEAERSAEAGPRRAFAAERGEGLLVRAAAAGRAGALGAAGLLGLQRVVGNAAVGAALAEERSPVHDVVSSGGQALDAEVRADMEARLGHDFGDVRVHTDGAARDSARAVNAHAYTVGSHVVFQREGYDPGSRQGRTTLAHELTHVVQQRSGPVEGTAVGGGIAVSDPADRFEREAVANAERAMAPQPAAAPAAVQREAAPPEPPPTAVVQREEEPVEDGEEP